jgi:hypothetical protein
MAKIKGTDVVSLRKYFATRPDDVQRRFRELLSQEAAGLFDTALSTTWSPVELQSEMYEAAAQALHPNKPNGVAILFHDIAAVSYSGIYRVFLRMPTLAFLISRAAAVWKSYFDTGEACGENAAAKSVDFVVRNFPSLPPAMQQATAGHLQFLVENAGAVQPTVHVVETEPSCWRWQVRWK